MREKIVEIDGLNKYYGTKQVLSDISMSVFAGEIVAFIGNNAAGKTTLLDIIGGFRNYDKGDVRVFGSDIRYHNSRIKKSVGYLPQSLELPSYLTVGELIDLFSGLQDTDNTERAIKSMNLEKWVNTRYKNLSGGLKRRTCAACILCSEPKLVLMDEPTSGMDATMISEVWNIVRTMSDQGITVIITTHSLVDALSESDRVMILEEGRCVYYGEPNKISKNNYEVSVSASLLTGEQSSDAIKANNVLKRVFNNVSEMSEYVLNLRSEGISDNEITVKALDGSILENFK